MKEIHAASFSGGRSSAMMVAQMLRRGQHLDHIIFCNTGMETPETLAFLAACNEQVFDGRLVCLEFKMTKRTPEEMAALRAKKYKRLGEYKRDYRIVSVGDLNRKGAPFTELTKIFKALPSHSHRYCTVELKIETSYRYLYDKVDYHTTYINKYLGLRADEKPGRVANIRARSNLYDSRIAAGKKPYKWTSYEHMPLADEKITSLDVLEFWRKNPLKGLSFDPADPAIRLSNCYGCFFGNEAEMINVARNRPDMAETWAEMERWVNDYKIKHNKPKSYKGVLRADWVAANLGRDLTEREKQEWGFNEVATWDQMIEMVRSGKRTLKEMQGVLIPIAGGCGDGECGLDI